MTQDHVPGNARAQAWGDEGDAVEAVLAWAARRVVSPSNPKATARPASELAAALGVTVTVTAAGIGWHEALRLFDEVLIPATRSQDDPMNLAYVPAAPTRAAVAFDLATSAANIFAGTWEAGAGAIAAENQALRWLSDLAGWPVQAGGCFVSGGTMGNLSALVAARESARLRRRATPPGGWALACTREAHSSIRAAARVMDVGVVDVPEDEGGHLRSDVLARVLRADPRVFAVVASAGTTNAGIVDDLAGIADSCAEYDVWMHVDGAYGGAALASSLVRQRFLGIERADSLVIDPHKWLFAPYDCCALLYRNPDLARAAHAQTAEYLDLIDRESWNPTDLAVHLSRRARGLPFWFSLATHGTDRYAAAVDRAIVVAREVAAGIVERPYLRLLVEPELSVVLFDRPGWSRADYDAWSHRHAAEGDILCVPTSWRGATALRLAFVNPETEATRVLAILDTLR